MLGRLSVVVPSAKQSRCRALSGSFVSKDLPGDTLRMDCRTSGNQGDPPGEACQHHPRDDGRQLTKR